MKPIRIENGIVIYYGNLAGRIRNGQAVVDPMFQVPELKEFLENQMGLNRERRMELCHRYLTE